MQLLKLLTLTLVLSLSLFSATYQESYLKELKKAQSLEKSFKSLIVQSKGRMKPMDSLSREVIRKLSSKESLHGLSANQLILGMFFRPDIFKTLPMIKIKTSVLKHKLDLSSQEKFASFNDFFLNGEFKLVDELEEAYMKRASARSTFEHELIKVNEKVNIAQMVYSGTLLKIFPSNAIQWLNFKEAYATSNTTIQNQIEDFIDSGFNRNFEKSNALLSTIHALQQASLNPHKPTKAKVQAEILFNSLNLFGHLTYIYILLGLLLFIYAFYGMVKNIKVPTVIHKIVMMLSMAILVLHTLGLAVRWVVGGYAPFSNTYESIVYIAFSCAFAGVVFFRHFFIALSASFIMAGIFMFTAHLGHIDPEITTLVPVLKSFWLTIHVSVITASYGFFGVSALLGAITLVFFMFRFQDDSVQIKRVASVNEVSLILGLSLLVIGNFLGGVWANESWGRYWGWDPKETWAYVAIVTYVLVLHLRFIKRFNTAFAFSVASLLAFSTILMTYFGVNFYLSGMHSYATGDPLPIPTWVYVLTTLVFVTIAIAYRKRDIKPGEICTIQKDPSAE